MRQITGFQTEDGAVFATQNAAEEHERAQEIRVQREIARREFVSKLKAYSKSGTLDLALLLEFALDYPKSVIDSLKRLPYSCVG